MKLDIYRNNRADQKEEVEIDDLLKHFVSSEYNTDELPFERCFLNYIMPIGTIDTLTNEQWNQIYKSYNVAKKERLNQ